MPELPEVETVVRGLRPLLEGRRLGEVIVRRADLRWPLPDGLGQALSGARVVALWRRGKYGLIGVDRGVTLLFHLGMSGRFRPMAGGEVPGPHDHLLFGVEGGQRLAYCDPRRFGSMHLIEAGREAQHPLLAAMGPEPLDEGFDGAYLARMAEERAASIKALLLDQKLVAGIGNIYASEALFEAGINPVRRAGWIADRRLERLAQAVKAVLARAIEAGGSTLRDHQQVTGELGYFQHQFRVYGRGGLPCPVCGAPIRRRVQQGRSTFSCPHCQR